MTLTKFWLWVLILCTIMMWFLAEAYKNRPHNAADGPTKEHSGLRVLIDHETGVNYLSDQLGGGITPRLRRDGSLYVSPQ